MIDVQPDPVARFQIDRMPGRVEVFAGPTACRPRRRPPGTASGAGPDSSRPARSVRTRTTVHCRSAPARHRAGGPRPVSSPGASASRPPGRTARVPPGSRARPRSRARASRRPPPSPAPSRSRARPEPIRSPRPGLPAPSATLPRRRGECPGQAPRPIRRGRPGAPSAIPMPSRRPVPRRTRRSPGETGPARRTCWRSQHVAVAGDPDRLDDLLQLEEAG